MDCLIVYDINLYSQYFDFYIANFRMIQTGKKSFSFIATLSVLPVKYFKSSE